MSSCGPAPKRWASNRSRNSAKIEDVSDESAKIYAAACIPRTSVVKKESAQLAPVRA